MEKGEGLVDKAEAVQRNIVTVVRELQLGLPHGGSEPFGIWLINLFAILGGVAIVGNVFADNYAFEPISFWYYIFRLTMGLLLITTAYSLHRREFLSLWLLGIATFVSCVFTANPILGIFPGAGLLYLYLKRSYLRVTREVPVGKFRLKV